MYTLIALFNRHWDEVYQFCLRFSNDEEAAKDLTQNIFLSVWERKIEFPDTQSASRYLNKSAKYQALNYLRNKKDTVEVNESVGFEGHSVTNRTNPESVYICAELSSEITLRITALAEPARTIFLLSREQELSYREIAEQMGIAVKTVEKHMTRALQKLRASLLAN